MKRLVLTGALVACAAVTALAGCRKREEAVVTPPPPAPSAVPVDHLAENELIEGTVDALGLKLPRAMKLQGAFANLVRATGDVPVTAAASYVKARVRDGSIRTREGTVIFDHVHARGDLAKELDIHVSKGAYGLGSVIEVRDVTPPPKDNLPDDDARFRAAGIDRNGNIIDPQHLQ